MMDDIDIKEKMMKLFSKKKRSLIFICAMMIFFVSIFSNAGIAYGNVSIGGNVSFGENVKSGTASGKMTVASQGENISDNMEKSMTISNSKPDNIRVNLLKENYGVSIDNIRFSWQFNDEKNNEYQTMYRILISSRHNITADVYDSGWVESSENTGVFLAGLSEVLAENELYYVQVQTKNSTYTEGVLSDKVPFVTFVGNDLSENAGIWCKDSEYKNFCFLRSKKYNINKNKVEKAIINVAASGTLKDKSVIGDIYFNGEVLGIAGPRTLHIGNTKEVYYSSYDVTGLVNDGEENVISLLGASRDSAGFLVWMELFYIDGTKEMVANSARDISEWKALNGVDSFGDTGDYTSSGYLAILRENIDTNYYPMGFYNVDFDDTSWDIPEVSSVIYDSINGNRGKLLKAYPSENIERFETVDEGEKVFLNNNGNLVIDFGKEIIGGIKVNVNAELNEKFSVMMGEEILEDNTVKYNLNTRFSFIDAWILKKGENNFSTITMRNFRYVEFKGMTDSLKIYILNNPDSVNAYELRQNYNEDSISYQDSSDDDILERLFELGKYSLKETNQDILVDSQARERTPYEGDLYVNAMLNAFYNDNFSLVRHTNRYLLYNPTWPGDYRLFTIWTAYNDYLYSGDDSFIVEHYEKMKTLISSDVEYEDEITGFVRCKSTNAMSLVDWPEKSRDGYVKSYYDVIYNSELVKTYEYLMKMAEITGNAEDKNYYEGKYNLLKSSLIQYAYNEETGQFCDSLDVDLNKTDHYSMHAGAYALFCGIYDNEKHPEMTGRIADYIYKKCKYEFSCSIYMTYFVLCGLYDVGEGDIAYKLLTNENSVNNGYTFRDILDMGCTISPEAWNENNKPNMTYSHAWSTGFGVALVSGMTGFKYLTPGGSEVELKLQQGDLTGEDFSINTSQGNIAFSFEVKNNKIVGNINVPCNQTMHLYIPDMGYDVSEIIFNNTRIQAEKTDNYFYFELKGGSFSFETLASNMKRAKSIDCVSELSLRISESTSLDATITPAYAYNKNLIYESNNERVAVVDNKGKVTGISKGSTVIKVMTEDKSLIKYVDVNVENINIKYASYLQTYAWQDYVDEGNISGIETNEKRVEAIKCYIDNEGFNSDISARLGVEYATYNSKNGWGEYVANGEKSGTIGKSLGIECMRFRLTGLDKNKYDIYYRVYTKYFGWLSWTKNGAMAGTNGFGYNINAYEVMIVKKGYGDFSDISRPYVEKDDIGVIYTTHVQSLGWREWAVNDEMSGTVGLSKRLEGIKIELYNNTYLSGGIRYKTHVQSFGWGDWVSDGLMSGSLGKAKRLEGIYIELTGELADFYDVYYKTQVEKIGWQEYVKNGELSGTTGKGYRLEAIKIKVVKK